jgi:glutathione S-transferase
MIVYGSTFSPFVRKLVAYLRERGMDFDLQAVTIGDPNPAFRAASPLGKMPAIVDGDFGLADSSAIIHYLEAKRPDGGLLPRDPEALGKALWWEEYGDTIAMPVIGKMFFNRIVAPVFLQRPGDEPSANAAERDELPKVLAFLDERVPGTGDWLVDNRLTVADLALASPLLSLEHCGVELDAVRFPRLAAWLGAIGDRPSFAESLSRERAFLTRTREPQ